MFIQIIYQLLKELINISSVQVKKQYPIKRLNKSLFNNTIDYSQDGLNINKNLNFLSYENGGRGVMVNIFKLLANKIKYQMLLLDEMMINLNHLKLI